MGKRIYEYDFPVFELETMGYFISITPESYGTVTIAKTPDLPDCPVESFTEVRRDGSVRVVIKKNHEDHSFYTDEVKSVLEYLSEPRWIMALNKHEKV